MAATLLARGVGVEAGLWHEVGAAAWLASPLRSRCRRVLLELPDGLVGQAVRPAAEALLQHVGRTSGIPVLLHGEGSSCWPALRLAAQWGLDTRVGLEDTLRLPEGAPAPDNESLVRAAFAVLVTSGQVADLTVIDSAQVDARTRVELRDLWDGAFGGRFSDDDADHAYGGVHVLAREGERLVAHAGVVPRRIRHGDGPWRTIGYVEAVAVDPGHQGRGLGRRVMRRLQEEIALRHPAAMLSTGRATAFYERLGWERWQGLSFTHTGSGPVADDEHGGLMVLRLDPAAVPDLTVDATCEDRAGDAW